MAARLAVIRRLRHALADAAEALAEAASRPGAGAADIMVAEVMPLLAACRFLERRAAGILAPRRMGARDRPLWLFGTRLLVRRTPFGRVLVIGPANYPLFLPAVQAIQALVAGNTVAIKPAPGCGAPMRMLAGLLRAAGLAEGALEVLEDSAEAAGEAIAAGVDLVVLTGASSTGRAVLADLAPRLVPAIMELSGEDAFIVLAGADIAYARAALEFGRAFNGGRTCIAPRRVIATRAAVESGWAMEGARIVEDSDAAILAANEGCYALGASVFGRTDEAEAVASRLRAGCVVVGDVIAPTADPRLPFGGAGESGFGATRGAEGLLAMTRPQAVVTRARPEWRHLAKLDARAAPVVAGLLRLAYGRRRWRAARDLARMAWRRRGKEPG